MMNRVGRIRLRGRDGMGDIWGTGYSLDLLFCSSFLKVVSFSKNFFAFLSSPLICRSGRQWEEWKD